MSEPTTPEKRTVRSLYTDLDALFSIVGDEDPGRSLRLDVVEVFVVAARSDRFDDRVRDDVFDGIVFDEDPEILRDRVRGLEQYLGMDDVWTVLRAVATLRHDPEGLRMLAACARSTIRSGDEHED